MLVHTRDRTQGKDSDVSEEREKPQPDVTRGGAPQSSLIRYAHTRMHVACASSLRWRACSQHSAAWILQARGEAGHSAKKPRKETTPPSNDAEQPPLKQMLSPRVSLIWFRPYRLYNWLGGKGSTSCSLRRTAGADRYARREHSRSADHAGHARCAAPDRPVVQPPPSVRTCVGLLSRCCTSWLYILIVQARPSRSRLKKD